MKVEVKSRLELRRWLKKNQKLKVGVWLVTYKKNSSQHYLPYDELVDELICFGWIDSLPRSLDEKRSMRLIAPRKPKSSWSKKNKNRVKRLIAEGLMMPSGFAAVELAKKNGSWSRLDDVETLKLPADLSRALRMTSRAWDNFNAFPPSSKRLILEWINGAKTAPTREKRILETAQKAEKNLRANHYRQPKGR